MKTRKTMCICLAVIAVIAVCTGAIRLWHSSADYRAEAADARQKLASAEKLMREAERLGMTEQIYTAAGAPTKTVYADPMFTDGLYKLVDAYRPENRLYHGVSALMAQPELQGAAASGDSYASILETATSVYESKLQTAEEVRHQAAVSNCILIGLGVLGLALGVALLITPDEKAASEQETQPRWRHRPHTPLSHLT